jgi:hypothetical protein
VTYTLGFSEPRDRPRVFYRGKGDERRRLRNGGDRWRGKETAAAAGKKLADQDGADEILLRRLVPGESSRLLPFSPPP